MARPVPRPEIAAYIKEVGQPGVPWISTSHYTLWKLYVAYSSEVVEQWLKEYFDSVRAFNAATGPTRN